MVQFFKLGIFVAFLTTIVRSVNLLIPAKETLTLEEAAVFLGMKRSTLYKMTHEHTIPFYRPNGKMIYFEKSDLLEWVRQNREDSIDEIAEEARLHMQMLGKQNR